MTSHHSDILLPRDAWSGAGGSNRLVAFVPIAIALVGIAGVLFGGITAGSSGADHATVTEIDPVTTGSIMTPEARRKALRLLDR
jgi:hypothetical protein